MDNGVQLLSGVKRSLHERRKNFRERKKHINYSQGMGIRSNGFTNWPLKLL
jgi:hypothetical protein